MYEIDEAAKTITEAADPDANIIFGAIIDDAMAGEVKITVIATGFDDVPDRKAKPSAKQEPAPRQTSRLGALTGRSFGFPPRSQPQPVQADDDQAYPSYQPQAVPEPQVEEDELEVPAFIRRKLQ